MKSLMEEKFLQTFFAYDYNRQFIIAKQKPLLPPDPFIRQRISLSFRSRHGLLLDNNQERAYRIGSYEFGCF